MCLVTPSPRNAKSMGESRIALRIPCLLTRCASAVSKSRLILVNKLLQRAIAMYIAPWDSYMSRTIKFAYHKLFITRKINSFRMQNLIATRDELYQLSLRFSVKARLRDHLKAPRNQKRVPLEGYATLYASLHSPRFARHLRLSMPACTGIASPADRQ